MDFEGTLREMASKGNAAICVPAALKDAGVDVPQSFFWEATLAGRMNFEEAVARLGYGVERPQDIDLAALHQQLKELQAGGKIVFITIGMPTNEVGIFGHHVNSVLEAVRQDNQPAFRLGGIPPFGEEKGHTFDIPTLQHFTPNNGIILISTAEVRSRLP